jgi:hypothetical protein
MRTLPDDPHTFDEPSKAEQLQFKKIRCRKKYPSCRSYQLTISHKHKFIWFRVAKVGTRSILNYFIQNDIQLDVVHPANAFYGPNIFRDYFKFAFVRNPFDRLVSCWTSKVINYNFYEFEKEEYFKMKEFENFVDYVGTLDLAKADGHLRLQRELIDLDNIDFLGRMENFENDFHEVCRRIHIVSGQLVNKNKGKRTDYRDYYTPELAEKVYKIYEKDIRIFNYTF